MEANKRCGILQTWWLSVSIQRKMLMFVGVVIFTTLFLIIFSIGMVAIYLRDFNMVLGDSYTVNETLNSFERESSTFKSYANRRTRENFEAYDQARHETAIHVGRLRTQYGEISLERYLLAHSIQTAHFQYAKRCQGLLNMNRDQPAFITEYYTLVRAEGYISHYLKDLMEETLEEGNQIYFEKVRLFRFLPAISAVIGLVVLALSSLLCNITVRHIINPVLKIAQVSKEIAANRLDVPDVQVPNRDEIGELALMFNAMKQSMAHSITALKEKNEMEKRLHREEVQRINAEKSLKTMQMSLLQSQINPHFLFNTLNIISRMAKIEEARHTEELIRRLANLFRYNLQTESEQVTLTREINIIHDYLYIQHRRFGSRIGFEMDCRVDAEQVLLPTFTLQPLVENAVIHGISPKEEGGRIRIRIREKAGNIVLTVTDSGQGMPPDRRRALLEGTGGHRGHVSGIGISNVKTRLQMLYPGARMDIFSRVGLGTAIRIAFPANHQLEGLADVYHCDSRR